MKRFFLHVTGSLQLLQQIRLGAFAQVGAGVAIGMTGMSAAELTNVDRSQLHALMQKKAHEIVHESSATKLAYNPGQQWTTRFDGRGFETSPQERSSEPSAWSWGLQLEKMARGADQWLPGHAPVIRSEGSRVAYDWGAGVQEWFVNDDRGLEHGFTLLQRLDLGDGSDSLTLDKIGRAHV